MFELLVIFSITLLLFYLYFYVLLNKNEFSDYIAKLNEKTKESVKEIPKIIIQTGPAKISPKIKTYMAGLKKHNPDFKYMFFSDEDIELFLKTNYPEYYNTYNRLPRLIQRLDFFRYIAVYHYGGFYFDIDMESFKPIDASLLAHDAIFPVDEYITPELVEINPKRYKEFYEGQFPLLLGQYAFAAYPKHPFIKMIIDTINTNVREYVKLQNTDELYVYRTTGPDFITSLFMNYDKGDVFILDNGERQVFGNYAKHRYAGTWK